VLGNAALVGNAATVLPEARLTDGFGAEAAAALRAEAAPHGPAPRPTPLAPPAPPHGLGSRPPPARPPSPVLRNLPPPSLPPLPLGNARAPAHSPPAQPLPGAQTQPSHAGLLSPPSASPAVQPYASVFIEPSSGSLVLPALPDSNRAALPQLAEEAPALQTRISHPAPQHSTPKPSPQQPLMPPLAHTAWEVAPGTLPAAFMHAAAEQAAAAQAAAAQAAAAEGAALHAGLAQPARRTEPPGRSIEALALRGLRELAASLLPGQAVESAADVVQLITKLHDALEMFCRCFIPVREACSRFIPTGDLERSAAERCQQRSASYLAIERALEPRSVAAALLDWRNADQDAPRAVEHILADLMLHHLALSQAAIEGTRALLDELSPGRLEGQQPRTPSMLTRLGIPGARERALWEAFVDRHAELQAAGRSFRDLFGDSFSRAYAAHYPGPGSGPSL
jgi:hypothetical protein